MTIFKLSALFTTGILLLASHSEGHRFYISKQSFSNRKSVLLQIRGGATKAKLDVASRTSKQPTTTTEGASIPSEVFNLVKGIVGVGVLSLPAGES